MQGANFCWGDWANGGTNGNDCEGWWHGDGVFYPMDSQKKKPMAMIQDGLSNTLMVGEDSWNQTRATCDTPCYGLGFAWAHPVEACAFGNLPPNAKSPSGIKYADDDWMNQNGFHSKHLGGANFAVCDGSVKFIGDYVALGVFLLQCTVAGREVVNIGNRSPGDEAVLAVLRHRSRFEGAAGLRPTPFARRLIRATHTTSPEPTSIARPAAGSDRVGSSTISPAAAPISPPATPPAAAPMPRRNWSSPMIRPSIVPSTRPTAPAANSSHSSTSPALAQPHERREAGDQHGAGGHQHKQGRQRISLARGVAHG